MPAATAEQRGGSTNRPALFRLRTLVLLINLAVISTLLGSVVAPTPAYAAGTVLFDNDFKNRTVDGTGTVTVPTSPSGSNVACLTARSNSTTGPLLSCAGNIDNQSNGKLRLTDASANQIGGIYGATSLPTSNGLDVTFNTYQYGGTAGDGMSFVLAAVDPTDPAPPAGIGQRDGSLGYSPHSGVAGLANGYLGVGLDVFGNYSSPSYQGTGCGTNSNINAQTAGAVVVRGPGNGQVGYCGLSTTYTGVAASKVTLRATTRTASVVPVQVLVNPGSSSFTSDTGVSVAAGTYKVVATPVGGTAKTLTGPLPVVPSSLYSSSSYLNASGYPKQLAFGIIGSTSSATDVHEAGNVKVVTFDVVPKLAVTATSYVAASPALGAPVNYVVTPSVLAGPDVNKAISMTETMPTGVTPAGAFGSGWNCGAPSGQTISCTTTATSFTPGTTLPAINVVGIVTGSGVTSTTVQQGSTSAVSSESANPASDSVTTVGKLPTTPSGVTVTPTIGPIAGGGSVTISGSNITAATAIEIGTTSEQQGGTPVVVLPCSTLITSNCFTVSGSNLVVSAWPARSSNAAVNVTVVTLGVANSAAYTYVSAPATPAAPTATAGITSATVAWTAPAANGSAITGYVVTPFLEGVAQTPISYDASTTTRTLTGLTAGGNYTFRVAAVNAYGTSSASPPSNSVVPYAVPGAPIFTSVAPGDLVATLTWAAPTSNGGSAITGYVVTPYLGAVAQTPISYTGTATTRTVTGLTAGTAYTFTVAAVNLAGTGPPSARSAAVTPNALPTLTFPAPPPGEVGVAYSRQLTVNDGTSPYAWSVSSGSLPAGLTLNAGTGLLSGTPTASGSFTFTVQVTDASGPSATRSVTLVIAAAPAVTFAPAAGEVGVAYSQQPTVTGGTAPFTWSITAGSLPAGITLNPATGLVSGTPSVSGTFSVTIGATDAFSATATKTAGIVIAAQPTFTFATPAAGQVAVAYSTTFEVSGGTTPLTWSITAGSLPPGLSLNPGTGVLSGIPTAAGSYPVTISVVDAFNQSTTRAVTLIINPGPIVITKTANASSTVPGGTVAYTITVANTGGLPLIGLNFSDPLTGVLDDAAYNANATASTGTVSYAANTVSWSGNLAAGATATITYSVAVANPVTGNKVLTNTVTSTTLGTNCPNGSSDTRCVATVTVSGLNIVKTADVATTTPGNTVRFTVSVTNSGQTPYTGATLTDTLADVLDDATYDGNATATSGSVVYASPLLTWTGNLAVGATATITYTVTVLNPDPGNRSLTGTVVSPTAGSVCPSGNPATSCTATVTVLVPALSINNSSSLATTTPGSAVPYTVTIANTGQTPYTGASVTIALPAALDDATYAGNAAATTGTVAYAAGTGALTWTGNLAVGATATVTFSMTVLNPDPGDRILTTVASSSAAGSTCPVGSANAACTSTVRVLIPALTIVKSSDVSSTTPGSVVRYTVTVTNSGQTAYTAAAFNDALAGVLDDATANNDVTASSGTAGFAGSTVSWVGDLAVGASATITYSVTVRDPDSGDRSLASTVTSSTPFTNCPSGSSDPRCTSTVPVLIPGLTLSIVSDVATTTPGSTVRYTVTAVNSGQTAYAGTTVNLNQLAVLDDAHYNADAVASTGTLAVAGDGNISWTLGLTVGATATVTFTVLVDDPDGGDQSLVAIVSSGAPGSTCPVSPVFSACRSAVAVLLPGLQITKTAGATTVQPGGTVSYTITVLNNGQTPQTNASISDGLSQVLTDAVYNGDATSTIGTVAYAAPNLSWTGTLAVGASAVISYSVTVRDPDPGDKRLMNTVTSTAPGNNCPSGSTDARCTATVNVLVPALTIVKTASLTHAAPGEVVGYTIKVTNSGATSYPAATFADSLAGVLDDGTYGADAAATSGTVSYAGSTLTWTGALAVGASATITYSATVAQSATGNNLLQNAVTSTSSGSNCASGSTDPRCVSSVPIARLLLQQSYTETSTTPGSLVHLSATFTNTGQYPYTGITVTSPTADTIDDATPTGDQTATSGTLNLTATAITWTGNIPIGATITITGTLTVQNPDTGNQLLTGTLNSTAPGNNCPTNTTDPRCTANLPVLTPQLTITKTANTTFVVPGGTATYTITITNTGQTPYTPQSPTGPATITDNLIGVLDDATYNNNATATTGTLSYTNPVLTWTGNLTVGATTTITYTATAATPGTGDKTMVNPATSTTTGSTCPPATNNPACRTTVAVLTPALTITKTANVPNATLGSAVNYTITVTNSGQTPYASAAFSDPLTDVLDDATFNGTVSATTGTASYAASTISWSGALAVGQVATITYTVAVRNPDPGNKSMINTVSSSSVGSNCASGSGDPRCTATVAVVNTTTVTFTKTADVDFAAPGQKVTYTIKIANAGIGLTTSFSDPLADVLDDATYNNDLSATGGTASYSNSTVNWSMLLGLGNTATVTYSVTVKSAISGNQILTNKLTSTNALTSHNCASGSTDPRCVSSVPIARLLLQQSYTETSTTPGSLVHLSATFTNTGQYPYTGITVTSPTADTIDDATPTGDQTATSGTLNLTATAITWTGNIPIGATITITGTLTVQNPDTGNQLLTGTLNSTAPGNNCPTNTTDPRCTANLPVLTPQLTITKTANTTFVVPGGTATYTITITNTGQTPYTPQSPTGPATITDNLIGVLDDATYNNNATATTGTLSYTNPVLTWTGNLTVGATTTITYTATAATPGTGDKTMVNPATSTTTGSTCPPATNNPACRTTVAVLTPALTISSTTSQTTALPGDAITYTVIATNTGQVPYAAATFSAPLAGITDDATVNGNASATTGTVGVAGQTLTWTGALAIGASATITYSVTVKDPVTGDFSLDQTITSTTPGSICASGSGDPRCTTRVLIAGLRIVNTADVSETLPTGVVRYTGTFTNTGKIPYVGISVSDSFVDALDDAAYNGDAAATSGSLIIVVGSGRIVWTGDIPVGATVTITGSVTVNNPDTGNQVLRTAITTDAAASNCPVGGSDSRCVTSVAVRTPALTITKAANSPTTTPGGVVGYTITVSNPGETVYTAASVYDTLDGGLDDATYNNDLSATSGAVGVTGSTLSWTGNLARGQTVTITYSITIKNPDPGDKVVLNSVYSDELGSTCPTGSDNPACTTRVAVLIPALDIAITADTTSTTPGSTVGYTLVVSNTGQTPYLGASVTASLSGVLDDAAYAGNAVASSGSVGYAAPELTWTGDLAIGGSATITYSVIVGDPDPGNRRLTTTVSSPAPGSTCPAGSPCVNNVTVLIPALSIATTADRSTATPGDRVRFTITLTNTGETPYANASVATSLADVLDDATFDGTISASSGMAGYAAPNLTWTGGIPIGGTVSISYEVVIKAQGFGNRQLTSTVSSTAPGNSCPSGSGNAACTATVTVLLPRLTIAKSADRATTVPGGVVAYTIVITNDGEVAQTAVTVDDSLSGVLPDALYNNDAVVTGGGVLGYSAPTLRWTGSLPIGASATITYSVTVRSPDPGDKRLINQVSSAAPGSTCPVGGTAPACTSTVQVLVPALEIDKSASTTTVIAGSPVQYTVTVVNTGETPYAPAVVTDDLADVLDDATYAGGAAVSSGTVELINGTLVWTAPLAIGASATMTYSVLTTYPAAGDRALRNAAVSASDGSNCPPGGAVARCRADVAVQVPQLSFSKTADTTQVVAGGTVAYTIEATNTGEADYAAAAFSDSLTDLLDDATYNQNATASAGTVGYADGSLTWSGPLARGATVVVTFSIRVNPTITGDAQLRNRVVSTTVGSQCLPGSTNPGCTTTIGVEPSMITLTDLTPSFTLSGAPNSTVELDNAVTMTVTTNNVAGYTVSVRATDDALRSPGTADTIPVGGLSVRPSDGALFTRLSTDLLTVHSQDRPSGPGGDAVSNDYQVEIPYVSSGTYSTTLEYIATSQ